MAWQPIGADTTTGALPPKVMDHLNTLFSGGGTGTGGDSYDDTAIKKLIGDGDTATLSSANTYTDNQIALIPEGPKGDAGTSATITGASAITGAPGTAVQVETGGTNTARTFEFTIPRGDKGDKGDKGDQGNAGTSAAITSVSVSTGLPGTNASVTPGGSSTARTFAFTIPRGDPGEKGDKGDKGDTGEAGTGIQITGSVDTADDLQTTGNTAGDAYIANDTGLLHVWSGTAWGDGVQFRGPEGAKGDTGTTPTVGVGTVTTGAAGSSVLVTEGGTGTARTFNFTIPRGATGTNGTNATITSVTATQGAEGSQPSVTLGGSDTARTFAFTIPKGDKGDKGDKGNAGITPTLGVGTVTTGLPGSSASVSAGGTATARTFSFTIPRGDKGDKGDKGDTGDPAAFTIASKPATDAPSTYPDGITVMAVGADATWPAPWSAVETVKHSAPHRMWQTLVERTTARSWRRTPGTDTDTWNPWVEWGAKGDKGDAGNDGLSAYQVAQADGFTGTEAEWLDSLGGSNDNSVVTYDAFHEAHERHQGITVLPVSYIYPDYYATATPSQWKAIGDAVPTVQWAMINPGNGPGTEPNTDFQAQLKRAVADGLKVMGYISTVYATRPQTEVHAEVAQYMEWYPEIQGIFLDEAVNGWSEQAGQEVYYQELRNWFNDNYPQLLLINNPGATTTPAMVPTADIMMSFENTAQVYLNTADADINQNHYLEAPKNKFWHAIYNVTDEATALAVIEKAKGLHVGHIYLTDRTFDSNPWGGLPADWLWELQLKEYGSGSSNIEAHSELTGLDEDDHPQYALSDGSRGDFATPEHTHVSTDITDATALATPNKAVIRDGFGGFAAKYIWGLDTPGADGDAAPKGYVDTALGNKLGNITASSTTLSATEPATVEVTGTGDTRNLAFGIPTGPKGDAGNAGTRGATWYVSGQNGVTTATSSVTGMIAGDIHLNASSGAISRYSGSTWASAGSIKGVSGTRGATWYIAGQGTVTTATSSVTGMITGDIHLNPTTGTISRYSGSTWVAAGNIQGPKGDAGTNGTNATITGATANTLTAGSPATVELGGSETARTFTFGIPAGPKGDKGDKGDAGTSAPIVNTIFTVRYTGTAWEFASLAEAQAAGLNTEQTIWFIGNPGGSMPAWAREGDIWTQG